MAERIKRLRLRHEMTQEELGEKIGVKRAAINKYENGSVENMKRTTIEKMAVIFDVSPAYLMCFDNRSTNIQQIYNKLTEERQDKVYNYAERQLEEQENFIIQEPAVVYLYNKQKVPTSLIKDSKISLPPILKEVNEENIQIARFVLTNSEEYYNFGGHLPIEKMSDEALIEEANDLLQDVDTVNTFEQAELEKKDGERR